MKSVNGKLNWDYNSPWYHGSPLQLQTLRQGSTITQDRDLARIFSHKPQLVSVDEDGNYLHDGVLPGYLYIITDQVLPQDLTAHPFSKMNFGKEWLTNREFTLHLVQEILPRTEEKLTDAELQRLKSLDDPAKHALV